MAEAASPSTANEPTLEEDVRTVVARIVDDVVLAEKRLVIESVAAPDGLKIKVAKGVYDIAVRLGVSPFDYIPVGPLPVFPKAPFNEESNSKKKRYEIPRSGTSSRQNGFRQSPESQLKKHRGDSEEPSSSSKNALFKGKRIKCITQNCKVCLAPMDQREFLPDGETFYCSVECIHKKVKQVRKTLSSRDQIFVTDRRGRLHANYVPNIENLEAFLLRRPNYEPCVRVSEEEQKSSTSTAANDQSRSRIRETFSEQLIKRCLFHDIDITEKKARELSHQVEFDLFDHVRSVKDARYRNWCKTFLRFIIITGKAFLDKLLDGTIPTSRLVQIPDNILDNELRKMDEIEAAAEKSTQVSSTNGETRPKPVTQPLTFPFKYRAEPVKRAPSTQQSQQQIETGRSAIDDILGSNTDTTSKHMSHLYDANCDICKRKTLAEAAMLEKVKKSKQDKERERELRRTETKEDILVEKGNTIRSYASTTKIDRLTSSRRHSPRRSSRSRSPVSRRRHSDDDISLGGGGADDDFDEPLPPGHSPPRGRSPNYDLFSINDNRRSTDFARLPDNMSSVSNSFNVSRKRRRSSSPDIAPGTAPPIRPLYPGADDPIFFKRKPSPDRRQDDSWRLQDEPIELQQSTELDPPPNMDIVWNGVFVWPRKYDYKCDFSLVMNKTAAFDLQKIMPDVMRVNGTLDTDVVWSYLDTLRNAKSKDIITLLMHPPPDDAEYKQYVEFYQYLLDKGRMVVIDVHRCIDVKDLYLFALPPLSKLHSSCEIGDGPGLSPVVQRCGNILAVVVKHLTVPEEKPPSIEKMPGLDDSPKEKSFINYDFSLDAKPSAPEANFSKDSPFSDHHSPFNDRPQSPFSDRPKSSIDYSAFDNGGPFAPSNNNKSILTNLPMATNTKPVPPPPVLNNQKPSQETYLQPPPPPPPMDDRMDMSSGEEGEIHSPAEYHLLPPPPPPPPQIPLHSGFPITSSQPYEPRFEQLRDIPQMDYDMPPRVSDVDHGMPPNLEHEVLSLIARGNPPGMPPNFSNPPIFPRMPSHMQPGLMRGPSSSRGPPQMRGQSPVRGPPPPPHYRGQMRPTRGQSTLMRPPRQRPPMTGTNAISTGPRPMTGANAVPTGPRPMSGANTVPTGPRSMSGANAIPLGGGEDSSPDDTPPRSGYLIPARNLPPPPRRDGPPAGIRGMPRMRGGGPMPGRMRPTGMRPTRMPPPGSRMPPPGMLQRPPPRPQSQGPRAFFPSS